MKSSYKPLIVAVFLTAGGLMLQSWHASSSDSAKTKTVTVSSSEPQLAYMHGLVDIAQGAQIAGSGPLVKDTVGTTDAVDQNSATVHDPGQPIGPSMDGSEDVQYTVKKGDTLSSVAARFHVSATAITNANPSIRKKTLKIGAVITIPGVVPQPSGVAQSPTVLPNYNSYFRMPAQGYNNGTDIINACGTPVTAAAEGVVVPDKNIVNAGGGWNDGYGTFVLIEHPFGNGIFTRYAHLETSLVQIGDYVKQGQQIGLMGQTGDASACSLSFSVIGARNPFTK